MWILISGFLLAEGIITPADVAVVYDKAQILEALETASAHEVADLLQVGLSSNFSLFSKPCSYWVENVGAYTCLGNGTNGHLEAYNTDADQIINWAVGNTTTNGGIVHLNPMNISIDNTILHQDRVWLRGSGRHKTIIRLADNTDAPIIENAHQTGNHDMGCRISDLTLYGNWNNNNASAHGIKWFAQGTNQYISGTPPLWISLEIENVEIWTTQGAGIILNATGSTNNPMFWFNDITGGGWGGSAWSYGGFTLRKVADSWFNNMQFSGPSQHGVWGDYISSCKFNKIYIGVADDDGWHFENSNHNIISDCKIDNYRKNGLYFGGWYGCDDNLVDNIRLEIKNLDINNTYSVVYLTGNVGGGDSIWNQFRGIFAYNMSGANAMKYGFREDTGLAEYNMVLGCTFRDATTSNISLDIITPSNSECHSSWNGTSWVT